jgi:Icc-related predicted phosphoesterase
MRILGLADIHGKFEIFDYIKKNYKKKDFDAITISGDIWEGVSSNGRYEILSLRDWCKKPIIMCQGNHCFWDNQIFKADKNVYLLHNESITIDGVVFYGSPMTTVFMSWNWMQTEDNLYNIWDSTMPEKIDVAVMHQPPYFFCDNINQSSYGNNSDSHLGSHSLGRILNERDIKYCFVGHLHTADRYSEHPNGTKVINCACLDEKYQFLGWNPPPEIVELNL